MGEDTSLSANQLAGIYKIYHSLYLVKVPNQSPIIDQTLQELDLTTSLGLTVVSIERNGNDPLPLLQNRKAPVIPKANADDVLLLFGDKEHVKEFANYYQR